MTTQLNILQNRVNEQDERIGKLETRLRQSTANLTAIIADGSEINAEAACMLRRQVDEQVKHIEKLERQVMLLKAATDHDAAAIGGLRETVAKQTSRIEDLRVCSKMDAQAVGDLRQRAERLETATLDFHERIGKLEAALLGVTRCLIDGKVDVDVGAKVPGTMFHGHRILGSESVQTMVEVYHRFKE